MRGARPGMTARTFQETSASWNEYTKIKEMKLRIHSVGNVMSGWMKVCMVPMEGGGWIAGWLVLLRDHMRPGCRRGLLHPDMGRITGHASSFVSFWYDGGLQTSISGPPAYPGHVACVSSAPMQGTPCAFSGWRRCRYAIRQPRRGKRPRPRHRQIPGSLRKIFILVLPRPGACHGVRPACPASVCCVHGPRLR